MVNLKFSPFQPELASSGALDACEGNADHSQAIVRLHREVVTGHLAGQKKQYEFLEKEAVFDAYLTDIGSAFFLS